MNEDPMNFFPRHRNVVVGLLIQVPGYAPVPTAVVIEPNGKAYQLPVEQLIEQFEPDPLDPKALRFFDELAARARPPPELPRFEPPQFTDPFAHGVKLEPTGDGGFLMHACPEIKPPPPLKLARNFEGPSRTDDVNDDICQGIEKAT